MSTVIKIENLSKAYQLGEIGTGTISRDLERYWARVRGKEDPFLKIGEVNDRSKKGESDVVWSLRNLNVDIKQGDAVGIIGRNGAGKSTLLKILSRVTAPTIGSVKVKGRIASLLEVGTGFHPDLSGRENIYLNGAILGMRKAEIKRKFDEIVDFSGVERYVDTPVKRYSSGMYVRLAFAVAAHLESEILIVDEVLAVGDAEFQKKCLGKMGDVSKGEGRTVLFVSHNMAAINQLCNQLILLENGEITYKGDLSEGYEIYQKIVQKNLRFIYTTSINDELSTLNAYITSIELLNKNGADLANNEALLFKLKVKTNRKIENYRLGLKINNSDNNPVGLIFSEEIISLEPGKEAEVFFDLNNHNLAKGVYTIDFSIGIGNEESAIKDSHILSEALIIEITKKFEESDKLITTWNKLNWGSSNYNSVSLRVNPLT